MAKSVLTLAINSPDETICLAAISFVDGVSGYVLRLVCRWCVGLRAPTEVMNDPRSVHKICIRRLAQDTLPLECRGGLLDRVHWLTVL
jgi:hypothetical protein